MLKRDTIVKTSRFVSPSTFAAAGALLLLGFGWPSTALAVNKLTLANGKVMEFRSIEWRSSTKEYRVDTGQGIIPVPKAEVADIQVDRPADLDKAIQLIETDKGAEAITILEPLIATYKMTKIEQEASGYLAEAYFANKNFAKAASMLEDQIKESAPSDIPLENRRRYWQSLLALKREATLNKALDEAVASSNRAFACAGRLTKADASQMGGQREDALLDYLRVVTLYEDLKEFQPAALAGAVTVLEDLRDPRADLFRKKLAQQYPASPEAKRAAATL